MPARVTNTNGTTLHARVAWLGTTAAALLASCASDGEVLLSERPPLDLGELTLRYPGLGALTTDLVGAPERLNGDWRLVTGRSSRSQVAPGAGQGRWRRIDRSVTADVQDDGTGSMHIWTAGLSAPVAVRRLGATHRAETRRSGPALAIREASRGVDAVLFRREHAVEELLVVQQGGAPLGYQLDLPEGHTVVKTAERRLEVRRGGTALLRIRLDQAWDATGAAVDIGVEVDGNELHVELKGAPAYPVLLDPAWESTASLASPRERHTATLLADGRVLVTGGFTGGTHLLDSTEIFDPSSGSFTELSPMTAERSSHSATLLRSGRLLVVGGQDPLMENDSTAEVFDPDTQEWSPQPYGGPRAGHTATLLPTDGRVLITGGCSSMSTSFEPWEACPPALETAEIFEEGAAKPFTPVPQLLDPGRAQHRAVLLAPTGNEVLLVGGDNSAVAGATSSAELFDGATLSSLMPMSAQHNSHTATGLMDGRILIVGNWLVEEENSEAEIYDPASELFVKIGTTTAPRSWHTATLLPDGSVLLAGGLAGAYVPQEHVERWLPAAADGVGGFLAETPMKEARAFHTATLLTDGRVLVIGGRTHDERSKASSPTSSAELFEIDSAAPFAAAAAPWNASANMAAVRLPTGEVLVTGGTFLGPEEARADAFLVDAQGQAAKALAPMNRPRAGHTLTPLPSGDVLVAGGASDATLELFDVARGTFELTRSQMAEPRSDHTATLLPNGRVLLVGGTPAASAIETFDPVDGSLQSGPSTSPRIHHAATLLSTGRVLLTGGSEPGNEALGTALLITVPGGDASAATLEEKSMYHARRHHTATALNNGQVLIAGGNLSLDAQSEIFDAKSGEFLDGPPMNKHRTRHTATLLPSGRVLLAGGDALDDTAPTSAELFDPLGDNGGSFEKVGVAMQPRSAHIATLLQTGHVLLAGGLQGSMHEVWRDDEWVDETSRPQLVGPATVTAGTEVSLTGSILTGLSEASSGATNASPTNHPVFAWLPWEGPPSYGGARDWSSSASTWDVPATHYPGPGLLFAFVNGIRSPGVPLTLQPQKDGLPCETESQCASGHCVDSVCCESACGELCFACSRAARGTPPEQSPEDGTCSSVAVGAAPPRGECDPAEPCTTAVCDGQGQCQSTGEGNSCTANANAGVCKGLECVTACVDGADCPIGLVCTAERVCADPLAAEDQAEGCACRLGSVRTSNGAALAIGLAATLLGRRRRRQRLAVAPLAR